MPSPDKLVRDAPPEGSALPGQCRVSQVRESGIMFYMIKFTYSLHVVGVKCGASPIVLASVQESVRRHACMGGMHVACRRRQMSECDNLGFSSEKLVTLQHRMLPSLL